MVFENQTFCLLDFFGCAKNHTTLPSLDRSSRIVDVFNGRLQVAAGINVTD